jgi:ankyrin repeat protein
MASKLISASKNGDIEAVQQQLDAGVDPNSVGAIENLHIFSMTSILDKTTPIIEASKNGHIEIVRLLLEKGAEPDKTTSFTDNPPIIVACRNGYPEIVKLLLERGADPESTDTNNIPLICIASSRGQLDIVKILLETKGVDVDSGKTTGIYKTPLMYAIESRHKNVVEYLLEHGASLTHKTIYNDIPLTLAADKNDVDIFNIVYLASKSAGVNPKHENKLGLNVLSIATIYMNADIIEYLFLNNIFDIGDLKNSSQDIIETKRQLIEFTMSDWRKRNELKKFLDNIVHTILVTRNKNLPEDLVRYTTSFHKTSKRGGTKRFKGTKGTNKRRTKKHGTRHKK